VLRLTGSAQAAKQGGLGVVLGEQLAHLHLLGDEMEV
jgi:hypothetical protein